MSVTVDDIAEKNFRPEEKNEDGVCEIRTEISITQYSGNTQKQENKLGRPRTENGGSIYTYHHHEVETKQNTAERRNAQTTVGGSSNGRFKKARSIEWGRDRSSHRDT